ncbi:hypothetical protein GIB67_032889 [Kingdonia uniflora]|uniref:Protein kinase domain-containing protein n=1 Tax=Kingdonia uniflora TaxID=39325 RepID=A0A7J7NBN3_9MAGN|nr:hypothetical protein GIB67_032889 [Kingdonia uniflora]
MVSATVIFCIYPILCIFYIQHIFYIQQALVHLHHECRQRILYLDIKPEDILLDQDFRAVVSDFRYSESMLEGKDQIHTFVKGTHVYMASEWFSGSHGISEKCDIFSYGKVLLDLFFGERYVCLDCDDNNISIESGNTQLEQQAFHAFMSERITQKNLVDLLDKRLMEVGKVNEKEASSLVHTALLCLEEDPMKRPADMRQVVYMLEAKQDGIGQLCYKDVHIVDEGVEQAVDEVVELDEIGELHCKKLANVDEGDDEYEDPKNKLGGIQPVIDKLETRKANELEAIIHDFVREFHCEELKTATMNFNAKLYCLRLLQKWVTEFLGFP